MKYIKKIGILKITKQLLDNFSIISKSLKRKIVILIAISIFSAAMESLTLFALYSLINSYTEASRSINIGLFNLDNYFANKSFLGLIVIFSLIVTTFLKVYNNILQNRYGSLVGSEIGTKYMSNVIEEGINNTSKENYDEIISVISNDVNVVSVVYQLFFAVILAIFTAISICITLFSISGIKSIIAIFCILIFYTSAYKTSNKILREDGKKFILFNQKSISIARSIIENLRIILLDNKKFTFQNYFANNYKKSLLAKARISSRYQNPKFVIEGVVYTIVIIIFLLVEYNYLSFISLSELIGTTYGILRLIQPAQISFNFIGNLLIVVTPLNRINSKLFKNSKYLNKQINKNSIKSKINFESKSKNYFLRNISHIYEKSNKYSLKNINLQFSAGEKICITGKSGSGKSTLADILCGLLSPTKGGLTLNKTNIFKNIEAQNEWQKRISYVPQNYTMISDDIIENIIFDNQKNDIDIKRLNECLNISQINEFQNFKDQTITSSIANKLSGGQKQRINIARGLYKKADIYIFDEITSSLDVVTKKNVVKSIFNFLEGKTLFLITHDLSYLELFDKVIFLDNGQVEIDGSFDYVMNNSKKFNEYVSQVNNFVDKS